MTQNNEHILLVCLSRSDWVSTRKLLIAAGVSSSAIDRRITAGVLRSFGNGVVGLVAAPDGHRQLARACLLAHPDGALSHVAAAHLHGLPMGDIVWAPHLVVPHGRSRSTSSPALVRQSRRLPATDLTIVEGIRPGTVARTLADLVDMIGASRSEFLTDWAIKEGRCSASELRSCVEPLIRPGARGAAGESSTSPIL